MAYLKNGYKLMYEHRAINDEELARNLRATKVLPATTDPNVVYEKQDGTTVDPKTFKLIYEKDGRFYGSTTGKVENAVEFSVYSGNDLLLGKEVVQLVTITANKDTTKENFEVKWGFAGQQTGHEEITKSVAVGTQTRIYIEPDSLLRWDAAPTTCLVNNVATSLTMEGEATIDNKYYIDVTPSENTTVVFNTGSTQPVQP